MKVEAFLNLVVDRQKIVKVISILMDTTHTIHIVMIFTNREFHDFPATRTT